MNEFELFNNFVEPVCAFDFNNQLKFRNKAFLSVFSDYDSFNRLKKHFNFNLCYLYSENFTNLTPIDILLKSKENFHTVCTFQNKNEDYLYFYIYTYTYREYKIIVFKDITKEFLLDDIQKRYQNLTKNYNEIKENTEKYYKLQEHAQSQVLKMGIINKISLVIRETNDIETILSSALEEINNLIGSYKTYFSMREKGKFRIKYIINDTEKELNNITEYEKDIIDNVKNKEITVSSCIKEYVSSSKVLPSGVTRVIIPVHNKNKLLGIIVTFTKHKFNINDNREILQSIAVQLASSIIQAGLIQQLNKKNKKLQKTLNTLKETQLQLINTEKMASVGQLVAGVAHEINTPLASINSNNSIITKLIQNKKSLDLKNLEMLNDLIDINVEASKRIYDIVKSLKRFVRLDEAEFQLADINSELDLTLKLITHELKNNIKVEKKYSNIPSVMCSVNMLNQVFMNLLLNACHSIKEKETDGLIIISTEVKNSFLIVKIKDNGMGIKPEVQNKIFNAGFTTKKIGLGTGLGLAISKKIIELHRGTITFNTVVNEGTEFIVSIPV